MRAFHMIAFGSGAFTGALILPAILLLGAAATSAVHAGPKAFAAGQRAADRRPGGAVESAAQRAKLEAAVLAELNLARANPRAYAEFARRHRSSFQGNAYRAEDGRRIDTREGVPAVDEAIAFLQKAAALGPLASSRGLSLAAMDHVKDMGPRGLVGHRGSDTSMPDTRIKRHGVLKGSCGEIVSFGPTDAREIVLGFIVDDGVPNRGHRKGIFTPAFRMAGVAIGPHRDFGIMCVVDMASAFREAR